MRVSKESIVPLEKMTSMPGDWLREWAPGLGTCSTGPAMLLNKINLDALPLASQRDRSSAFCM